MEWLGNLKAGVVVESQGMKRASGGSSSHQSSPRKKHENNSQRHRSPPYMRCRSLLSLLILLMALLGTASAQKPHDRRLQQRRSAPLPAVPVEEVVSWKGPSLLVVDTRPPPVAPHLMRLQRRSDDATSTSSAPASKRSIDTDPNAAPSNFVIPTPFDTSLSNNFTASCAKYFKQFLTDKDFNDCHPFSLMLQVCIPNILNPMAKLTLYADLQRLLRRLEILCSHHTNPRGHLCCQSDYMSKHNERQGTGAHIKQQLRRGLHKRQPPGPAGIQWAISLRASVPGKLPAG